ncbi:MAG: hypothetical protein AABY64_00325 [Bdellovibrionota bacterium]
MAKRFTDTSKWAKESFFDLSLKMKLVWIYLCDNCDHAGVWDINIGLLSFQLGQKVTLEEIFKSLGDKIEKHENKILIPSFIEFQYGSLNPANRVHQSVLSRIDKLSKNKDLLSPLEGAKEKDKDKDKDLDKDKDKEKEERLDFEILFAAYPNKIGKAEGFKRLREQNLSRQDLLDFMVATDNLIRFLNLPKNRGWRQAQQFDVFVGPKSKEIKPWREWIKPDPSVFDDVNKREGADLSSIFGKEEGA